MGIVKLWEGKKFEEKSFADESFPGRDVWDTAFTEQACESKAANSVGGDELLILQKLTESLIEGEDNVTFSPVALYEALLILCSITDGNTRKQLEELTGTQYKKLEKSYKKICAVANHNNVTGTCHIESSMWLNDLYDFNIDAVKKIAEKFDMTSAVATMPDKKTDEAVKSWLNAATGGLLDDAMDFKTSSELVIMLLTTIYYSGKWGHEFDSSLTNKKNFTTLSGEKIKCDFMRGEIRTEYEGNEAFEAVMLPFTDCYNAVIILPKDKNMSPSRLLSDKRAMDILCKGICDREYLVKLSIPKFDITVKLSLDDALRKLGAEDVFNPDKADFSVLTDTKCVLSKAEQTTRIKFSEEGVEAASCVEMGVCLAALPHMVTTVRMNVDRPFLFSIISHRSVPVFAGMVTNPDMH